MAPPTQPLNLDVEAISGICGSISIACWVVVFSPQILENFRRSSADGLSIQFIIVWLLGDVFNILGAVLQGVLPTMIILAVYYTIADIVLLGQCFYYRGFTWQDTPTPASAPPKANRSASTHNTANERTRLLPSPNTTSSAIDNTNDDDDTETLASSSAPIYPHERERRGSDWSHLNPTVPLLAATSPEELEAAAAAAPVSTAPGKQRRPMTKLQSFGFNALAVLMVCAAGVAGWVLSRGYYIPDSPPDDHDETFEFNFWGQVFGWLCAVLYLGSRLPQLLLNFRRKSTDGVSILFFLFACLGNLTYVLSILAFDPHCSDEQNERCAPGKAAHVYWEYILVNLSWLAGSAGTLLLDFGIFVQFFVYSKDDDLDEDQDDDDDDDDDADEEEGNAGEYYYDERPVLQRGISEVSVSR
ncbi:PQ loop repeat-domain-containing protein [Apodospora peruviana]|uniref:PQ loop repeat-domain-containing protein n=1 Tax=Apodospora peruviana TaxID=516989 RepID=A0AAE0IC80_9PEZI|nr:PQ loop repeat-domain-containing protein [Apodospora peruviana]